MQNLHEQPVYEAIIERIKNLTSTQKALWGKMNVSQMLAHCCVAFSVPLAEEAMPRPLIGRLIGWMFKSKLYDNVPYKKGLPTSPAFIIKDEKNFEVEQNKLINLTTEFFTKAEKIQESFHILCSGLLRPTNGELACINIWIIT